jgi:hypothetical protein
MKRKRILLFATANLLAIIVIMSLVHHKTMMKRYGDRFRTNAFIMSDSVIINSDSKDVYDFFIHHYDKIYSRTAAKHRQFKLLNSDSIAEGTHIFCAEGEEQEMVYHNYVVRKVIPGRLIYKSSEPSTVVIKNEKGTSKNHCNTYVYVDFKDLNNNKSVFKFTIVMQMPNYFYKLIGRILGGKEAKEEWENHLTEELNGFKDIYKAMKEKPKKEQNL